MLALILTVLALVFTVSTLGALVEMRHAYKEAGRRWDEQHKGRA